MDTTSPVLVCLPGGPGVPRQYLKPVSLLHRETGIPVLCYDQTGSGDSIHLPHNKSDTGFWTFDPFIAELRNFISHLEIETYDLFGHSWGGMLAAKYKLSQPHGLRKLFLASTSTSIKLLLEATARQRLELPVNVRERLEWCEQEGTLNTPEYRTATTEFYPRHVCGVDPFPKELLESTAAMQQDDTVQSTLTGPSPFSVSGTMKDFDVRGELSQITEQTVPGGILNGKFDIAQDEVTSPFFTQPRARVEGLRFAESCHMTVLEETESFLAASQAFLEMPEKTEYESEQSARERHLKPTTKVKTLGPTEDYLAIVKSCTFTFQVLFFLVLITC